MLVVRFTDGTELALSEPAASDVRGRGCSRRRRSRPSWPISDRSRSTPASTRRRSGGRCEEHPHRLHAFLRDQRAIAGIGRAYANEILHAARLSPYAMGTGLTDEELERLHSAIVGTLAEATERLVGQSGKGLAGKAARGYAVHDRLGRQCPRCGNEIRQRLV